MHKLRPYFSLAVVALAVLLFAAVEQSYARALGRTDRFTGYSLAAVCLVILLLPFRKMFPLLNIGKVAAWQQIHHFAGVFSLVVFFFHAGYSYDGYLESMLGVLFLLLSVSGLGHWYVNRRIPVLMRTAGQPLRQEDLAPKRSTISQEAYSVALAAASHANSACLAEFYTRNLAEYFHQVRSLRYYASPNGKLRRQLQMQLDGFARYLDEAGLDAKNALSDLVRHRDDVDFQAAMMWRIRCWNIMHFSFSWSFVVLAVIHIYAVHAFAGD